MVGSGKVVGGEEARSKQYQCGHVACSLPNGGASSNLKHTGTTYTLILL